jgi:hypothetical protein
MNMECPTIAFARPEICDPNTRPPRDLSREVSFLASVSLGKFDTMHVPRFFFSFNAWIEVSTLSDANWTSRTYSVL